MEATAYQQFLELERDLWPKKVWPSESGITAPSRS